MRRTAAILALVLTGVVGGTAPSHSVEFAAREPQFPPRDYTCRVEGENAPLGAVRCLRTPQGQHAAECSISLNMSSWRALDQACP